MEGNSIKYSYGWQFRQRKVARKASFFASESFFGYSWINNEENLNLIAICTEAKCKLSLGKGFCVLKVEFELLGWFVRIICDDLVDIGLD
jgi:hypothetical protein